MSSRKSLLITALCFLFITNTSSAVMCARLKSVSGGEDHTLALADNNTLWACGGGPLGLRICRNFVDFLASHSG
ncbi:MAG: RCC1 domain-containing protein [Sedimentisphaerales bacterium]|nr:RCC1 domain-containing protein [Sedimentisphaerales bacterium]